LTGCKISNTNKDNVKWVLEKSGFYTTRYLYEVMIFRSVINKRTDKFWKSKVPMKLKIFYV
jgi:hypothetical protein